MQTGPTTLKDKLRINQPLLGSFVFSGDPNISEIYAECGYDFVIIDTEHALNDLRTVQTHLRACSAAGIHAVVRIGAANYADAPRLLDAGAEGIMIPHLGFGAAASEVIASFKYWPQGTRPTCTGVQIAGYGLRNFAQAAERANQSVLSIGLVEDRECLDKLSEVYEQTKVDWVMPGPADLASSLGLHGQLTHPDVRAAVDKIITEAQRKNIAVGVYINEAQEISAWQGRGVGFFVYSIDYKVLGKALRTAAVACREQRSGLPRHPRPADPQGRRHRQRRHHHGLRRLLRRHVRHVLHRHAQRRGAQGHRGRGRCQGRAPLSRRRRDLPQAPRPTRLRQLR